MRSTLALLLLFGAGIGVTATNECTLYELPKDGSCEKEMEYRARDADQALATCLEYFPTTFVKGEKTAAGKTKCIVTAAYQCVEKDTFLIFDKCYRFPKNPSGEYVKGTIADYLSKDPNKKKQFCDGGKLSVFYSYTHAKFVGMKAHRENIDKLWIGINSEGRSIEDNTMMHPKMWKLVEDDYWDGDKPKKIPMKEDGSGNLILDENKQPIPDLKNAPYYFMRTRTDNVYNRMQGHFERASAAVEATFACEFESKFTANQAWYCNKLPALGINSVYDDKRSPARCLYLTVNQYTFKGNDADAATSEMKNIKGCQERPSSDLHSSAIDDGTSHPDTYAKLDSTGRKLRLAGYLVERMKKDNSYGKVLMQEKCKGPVTDEKTKKSLRQKWRLINHHGAVQAYSASPISWDDKYPLNECSDFPGSSTTLGLLNGKKVDMPPEVRAPAVCSLTFFQYCENKKPCDKKYECLNSATFQEKFGGFFICECPGVRLTANPMPHTEIPVGSDGDTICKWTGGDDKCAWLHFYGETTRYQTSNTNQVIFNNPTENDRLDQVVVREGCKFTARSWIVGMNDESDDLIKDVGYGTHHVPNTWDGSLGNDALEVGTTSTQCTCS